MRTTEYVDWNCIVFTHIIFLRYSNSGYRNDDSRSSFLGKHLLGNLVVASGNEQVNQSRDVQTGRAVRLGNLVAQVTTRPEASSQSGENLELEKIGLVSTKDLSNEGTHVCYQRRSHHDSGREADGKVI